MTIDTAKEREYLKSQYGVGGRRYRFADPISGLPVWRYSPGLWNGQRPLEAEALYTHSVYLTASAALDVIDAQAAEIDALKATIKDLLAAYAEPDSQICCSGHHCGCQGATTRQLAEHYARAALSEREP